MVTKLKSKTFLHEDIAVLRASTKLGHHKTPLLKSSKESTSNLNKERFTFKIVIER